MNTPMFFTTKKYRATVLASILFALAVATAALSPAIAQTTVPLTLAAKLAEGGEIVTNGLVWRIFPIESTGQQNPEQIAKSDTPTPVFNLPPGDYVVHVAYGRAQISRPITVDPGPTNKEIILNTGGLKLNAVISDQASIPARQLSFSIYANSEVTGGRILIAQKVAPNSIERLNAGIYHVVSRFGEINAVVRADIRVEPGQLTEATLFHRAALMHFKLVSEPNGEAIVDTFWTVKSLEGQTLYTEFGAFPSAALAEGEYIVIAQRGEEFYNRDFQVVAGLPQEVEVVTLK